MLFQKFIDLIDWKYLKMASYKLNIHYLTIENHLKFLIYFQITQLECLRAIHEFMDSKSELTEIIKGVSMGSLSNYNNNINYSVLIPVMNSILIQTLICIPLSQRIKKFGSGQVISNKPYIFIILSFTYSHVKNILLSC